MSWVRYAGVELCSAGAGLLEDSTRVLALDEKGKLKSCGADRNAVWMLGGGLMAGARGSPLPASSNGSEWSASCAG